MKRLIKSETAPRYHARDVAIERARMNDASVLLGSATPSVDSYYQAMQGKYQLLTLSERVEKKPLPDCEVVDLRSELRAGNRSIFSERLQELMEDRLKKTSADHAVFKSERNFRIYFMQSLRICDTMSSL